jgi:hypothetical protein
MTDLQKAARQALNTLENNVAILPASDYHKALRAALAQQQAESVVDKEQAEPVAWMYTSKWKGDERYITRFHHDLTTYKADKVWPLYTAPQQQAEPVVDSGNPSY